MRCRLTRERDSLKESKESWDKERDQLERTMKGQKAALDFLADKNRAAEQQLAAERSRQAALADSAAVAAAVASASAAASAAASPSNGAGASSTATGDSTPLSLSVPQTPKRGSGTGTGSGSGVVSVPPSPSVAAMIAAAGTGGAGAGAGTTPAGEVKSAAAAGDRILMGTHHATRTPCMATFSSHLVVRADLAQFKQLRTLNDQFEVCIGFICAIVLIALPLMLFSTCWRARTPKTVWRSPLERPK